MVVRNLAVWVVSTGESSQGCSLASLHHETSSAPPSSVAGWVVYKFKLADLVQKLYCACIMKIGNVSMSALSAAPYRKNLADLGSSSSIGVLLQE